MFQKWATLLLVLLMSTAQPLMVLASGPDEHSLDHMSGPAPMAVQYVNFTDDTASWNSRFYPVTWPAGPFRQVSLTLTLFNRGDPWDRACTVGVNNVTLMQMTTKENSSYTLNLVQAVTTDITIFQDVFSKQGEVEWDGLSNFNGGWTAKLTFAFYPGVPVIEIPKVLPAIFNRYVNHNMKNMTNETVKFPKGTARAVAVLTEEGNSGDEFWFGNSAVWVRDFQLMINTTTVFDISAQPYINSGGALSGDVGNLYEWNATSPPGTGLRPQHFVNITPFAYLMNGTKNVTLAINEGQDYWMVGLSFLLYGPVPGAPYVYQDHLIKRHEASGTKLTIFTSAWSARPVTNGQEKLFVNYSSWLNTSSSATDVHEIMTVSRFIATSSIFIVMANIQETVFSFSINYSSGKAIDVHYVLTSRNTTTAWGNGQNSTRTDSYQDDQYISGTQGGMRSQNIHSFTRQYFGNISQMAALWNVTDILYQNVTGTNGIGKTAQGTPMHLQTGTPRPFPALFFITPPYEQPVSGIVNIAFAFTNASIVTASLDVNGNPTDVTGKPGIGWDTSALPNGVYVLRTTGIDDRGAQHVNMIRVFKGQRPTVLSSDPADKATLVPQDKAISIRFSMPMAKTPSESAFSIAPPVNGSSYSWNAAGDTLTWNHSALFDNNTRYNVTVHGNATNSYSVELRTAFAFSFRTWKPPFVTSVLPRPGAVNVTLNSTVSVTLSVPMNRTTVEKAFSISPAVGNGSFSWDGTGKTVIWFHKDLFLRNRTYKFTLGAGSKATDGTPMESAFTFNLSTVNPPRVLTVSPIDNATNVRLDASIAVNFTTLMDRASVEAGLSITPLVTGAFVWGQGSSSFSWQHATELAPNTTYHITIAAGVQDFGGVPMMENFSWSLKTATRPFILDTEPSNGAKDVDIFEPVIIAFSEPMDTATVEDGFSIDPSVTGEFSWNGAQELIWSHYKEGFRPGTECTLSIEATAKSALGVLVASQFGVTFTTAPRPTLVNTTPVDSADVVPIGATVWMTFSLPMNSTSVEKAFRVESSGPSSIVSIKWANASIVEFIPRSHLEPRTQYAFIIGTKAASLKNASLGADFRLTFRTGDAPDTTPPTIRSITPINGTPQVPITRTIVVTFSEPMNKSSVEKVLKVTADNRTITGSIVWGPLGDTLTFTPSVVLPYGARVEIIVGRSASDMAGNNMTSERHSWFRTVPKPKPATGVSPMLVGAVAGAVIAVVAVILAVLMIKRKGRKEDVTDKKEKGPSKKKK